jgi:transcriptional regulator with XRE-family HTH domain
MRKKKKFRTEIGLRIEEIRGERTLTEFGALLGVKNPTVYRYETDRIPGLEMMMKIAALDPLKRGIGWLTTGIDAKYGEPIAGQGDGKSAEGDEAWNNDPFAGLTLEQKKERAMEMLDELFKIGDRETLNHLVRQLRVLLRVPPKEG